MIASRVDLMSAIQDFYTMARSTSSPLSKPAIIESPASTDPQASTPAGDKIDYLIEKAEEAPVIKLVDLIIKQAIEQRASDIHIEPFKEKISLRYRIDGILYQIPPPSRNLVLPIVSRLKILSKLDIAENVCPRMGG